MFSFEFFTIYSVDVPKEKKEKKRKKENIVKVNVLYVFCLWMFFFKDKIAKNKEEFNILIWSRIKNYELTRKSYF